MTQLTIKYEPIYLKYIKCTVPTETPSVRLRNIKFQDKISTTQKVKFKISFDIFSDVSEMEGMFIKIM